MNSVCIEHPACVILSQYEEELKDSLPQFVIVLYTRQLISQTLLPPTLTEKVKLLLSALRDSVCLNHHNLETLAHVLQTVDKTATTGMAILEKYSEYACIEYACIMFLPPILTKSFETCRERIQ